MNEANLTPDLSFPGDGEPIAVAENLGCVSVTQNMIACCVCDAELFDGSFPARPKMIPCLEHAAHPAVLLFFALATQGKTQRAVGQEVIGASEIPLTEDQHNRFPRGRFLTKNKY